MNAVCDFHTGISVHRPQPQGVLFKHGHLGTLVETHVGVAEQATDLNGQVLVVLDFEDLFQGVCRQPLGDVLHLPHFGDVVASLLTCNKEGNV